MLHGLCVSTNTPVFNNPFVVLLIPSTVSGFSGYCGRFDSFTFGFKSILTGLAVVTNPSVSCFDGQVGFGAECLLSIRHHGHYLWHSGHIGGPFNFDHGFIF